MLEPILVLFNLTYSTFNSMIYERLGLMLQMKGSQLTKSMAPL